MTDDDQLSKNLFSENEYLRYTRHLQLDRVGIAGQKKLKNARVSVVGCGGLGAPVGLYLAAAGVGHLTLIDDDDVELSNLQRQISYRESDIGKSKALQSQATLKELNTAININAKRERLTSENADELLAFSDLVIDCTDNFSTRYAVNDYCKSANISWVYASIFQFSGQCAIFSPQGSCYRCLFPNAPAQAVDCNTAGVIGILPGILGSIQALEALKYLLELKERLHDELLLVETLPLGLRKIKLKQDESCPCCFPSDSYQPEKNCESDAPANKDKEPSRNLNNIDKKQFDRQKENKDSLVIDVRSTDEHRTFNIGGINIPLDQLAQTEIDKNKALVFYCHSGMRSDNALAWAIENLDNKELYALNGGIIAYLSEKP